MPKRENISTNEYKEKRMKISEEIKNLKNEEAQENPGASAEKINQIRDEVISLHFRFLSNSRSITSLCVIEDNWIKSINSIVLFF